MIPYLKNTAVGFAISFVGSIPLGYLNIIGLQYYEKGSLASTLLFLLGVVVIESVVIYSTARGAAKLTLRPHLKTKISIFSIIFLLLLAYLARPTATQGTTTSTVPLLQYLHYPFLTGIILSGLNVAQFPFWLSWNVYMLNEKYVNPQHNGLVWYTIGAVLGTFTGMLSLIIALHKTVSYTQFSFQKYIPFIFIGLAVWQVFVLIKNKIIPTKKA